MTTRERFRTMRPSRSDCATWARSRGRSSPSWPGSLPGSVAATRRPAPSDIRTRCCCRRNTATTRSRKRPDSPPKNRSLQKWGDYAKLIPEFYPFYLECTRR
uniref:(northern house mosquito) hypothetical protein n=1 Tax=Culex pipiens TaxID=7175 RepID=A0A8D8IDU6_CULPI